jgi:tetratricopeptide (TPR) repeat protein
MLRVIVHTRARVFFGYKTKADEGAALKTAYSFIAFIIIGLFCSGCQPESEKLKSAISREFDSPKDAYTKLWEIDNLYDKLASAYLNEDKYALAIEIYERKIEQTQESIRTGQSRYGGGVRRSAAYAVQAAQFELLALAYEHKGDAGSAAKAKKKAAECKQIADSVQKNESPKKSVLD